MQRRDRNQEECCKKVLEMLTVTGACNRASGMVGWGAHVLEKLLSSSVIKLSWWADQSNEGKSWLSGDKGCIDRYCMDHKCVFPWWPSWWRIRLQCGRPGFNPWVGKIPWRRERLPTPVLWTGEFHGLYSPWGCKESDMTERLSHHKCIDSQSQIKDGRKKGWLRKRKKMNLIMYMVNTEHLQRRLSLLFILCTPAESGIIDPRCPSLLSSEL